VSMLERELETWFAKRSQKGGGSRRDTMATILAAADETSRRRILSNMQNNNAAPLRTISARQPSRPAVNITTRADKQESFSRAVKQSIAPSPRREDMVHRVEAPRVPRVSAAAFDELAHLDSHTLALILRQVDPTVLALALAGSRDELVDRVCEQMPKRTARAFRRELRQLRPTRLSDVEAAQVAVAQIAAELLAVRANEFQSSGYSFASG
jgi:hypothetical protein